MQEELGDFQQRLEDRLSDLTKSQQRIATYLLAHHDEAAFLSAAVMAQRLDVSEATVARFAQAIGYDGLRELLRCLQELFRARVTPASRLRHKLNELASSQSHVLTNLLDMEVQYLAEASHSIDLADFDRAVDVLLRGERIILFCQWTLGHPGRLGDVAFEAIRHNHHHHDQIRPPSPGKTGSAQAGGRCVGDGFPTPDA